MSEILIGICYGCKELVFVPCLECANTIRIDPETNLPPDVIKTEHGVQRIDPDPTAVARSVQDIICDSCITESNKLRSENGQVITAEERHFNHRD